VFSEVDMSMHFFAKTLSDVKKLLLLGDLDSIFRAREIIKTHYSLISKEITDEEDAFVNLVRVGHEHQTSILNLLNALKTPHTAVLTDKERYDMIKHLNSAIASGKLIARLADDVAKLCKKEELDVQ